MKANVDNSLPPGWSTGKLGEVLPLSYGKSLVEEKRDSEGAVPVFGSSGMVGHHSRALVDKPTLIIGRKGNVGAVYHSEEPCWVIDTAYFVSNVSSLHLSFSRYLIDFLQLGRLDRSTAVPGLSRSDYNEVVVPIPPQNEQKRIVAEIEKQFTRLDAAVAALKRVQANLKRYRAAVLKAACEGRLVPTEATLAHREGRSYEPASVLLERILAERRARRESVARKKVRSPKVEADNDTLRAKYLEPAPPDKSGLAQLPAGWEWARAEQLSDFITKGTTPAASKLFDDSGEVPYIKVYNLTVRGTLDFSVNPTFISRATHEAELARSRVIPGDVLMNIVGPPLGKVSIVPSTHPEWNINQAIAIFRPMPSFNQKFLSYCLLTESVLTWAVRRSKATAGQFNLTLEICRDLPLPVPPADEQSRIVNELERRLSVLEELEMQTNLDLTRAERLRQSILKRAFEGKLVPQDPNDEPAAALLERIRGTATLGCAGGKQK